MMNVRVFDLERLQSLYENTVDYNLTESGFHPLKLNELLTRQQLEEMQNLVLGYGQTNGSIPLRKRIAAMYSDINEENILVTNGTAEANFIAMHTLLNPGDEVLMMLPNYMQLWGVIEEMGCVPKAYHLKEKNNWSPDLEGLRSSVTDKTSMIVVCNPNNPTGYVLSEEEMNEIVAIAEEFDLWIFSDEVYRGAELNHKETKSFLGMTKKVMVNGGLSKSYALPGLRLGWLAGAGSLADECWAYHDYTSISAGLISQYVAEIALEPANKSMILTRNRSMLNENLKVIQQWIAAQGDLFSFVPPAAGGMAFMRYNMDVNSSELSDFLRKEHGCFVVPGDCYGMDGYIRIGIGERKDYLIQGLTIVRNALKKEYHVGQ